MILIIVINYEYQHKENFMLNEIEFGSTCLIESVDNLDDLLKRRLQDLGLVNGSEVLLKSGAAFGGPLLISVNGQLIAIRRNDAKKIKVKVQ